MTPEIVLTLAILMAAIVLFFSEKLRVDLVALLILVTLVVTGLVTPAQALSGFANPAVVTVWAVFILSAGLSATGVAYIIGQQVLRISGTGEARLIVVIMLTAAVLSGFMNNVGVAALLLPVTLMIARQTEISPSRLLMPLATGCLLGGMMTLIGTPPNILVSDALRDAGFGPFQFFDFLPTGLVITLIGIGFVALVSRHLLPRRHPVEAITGRELDEAEVYHLQERLALIEIPPDNPLVGKTLAESRIGYGLGLTILGLQRYGRKDFNIMSDTILQAGDQLLALGRLDRLQELSRKPYLIVDDHNGLAKQLLSQDIMLGEWALDNNSPFIGRSINDINVRHEFGFNVLAIRQNGQVQMTSLQDVPLAAGARLLIQGERQKLADIEHKSELKQDQIQLFVEGKDLLADYGLDDELLWMRIPEGSPISGRTLAESTLAELFNLLALSVVRNGEVFLAPDPEFVLLEGDNILVLGEPQDLAIVRGLQELLVRTDLDLNNVQLETERIGLVEAVLAPRSNLVNKTLREIHFREKYELSVLAIWRNGQAIRSNLGELPLRFGDAFLIYGPRNKINLLVKEPDFIVLAEELEEPPQRKKAPLAVAIMLGVIVVVLAGWLPIAIAAVAGAALMVISGCLNMDDAYSNIEWRAVFLIAGMLPLATALEESGTAQFMAEQMIRLVGDRGPTALMAGFFVLTSLSLQFMPNAVVAVIMAPIALRTAADLGFEPQAFMMIISIAATAAFMSPVGHPANVLVMGPGGYRFSDYLKVGIPLTIVVLIVSVLLVPIIWPL